MPLRPLLAALVVALGLSGCDTEIAPTSADGRAFTVWGQLDPTTNRQAVRIDPIRATIDDEVPFEGTVTSVDLATGVETAWRDSLVTFPDGSTGYVFLADYRPAYDSRVELRVTQGGEVTTYARVTVPPRVAPYFGALMVGARNEIDLVLPGAPRVVAPRVVYGLLGRNASTSAEGDEFLEVLPVPEGQITSVEFGWRVRVDFTAQVETLRARFLDREIRDFNATAVRVRVAVANEEWAAPFPFSFSRELVIQPGTVSNVRGGYGFLGAAYTVEAVLNLDEDTLRRIGL